MKWFVAVLVLTSAVGGVPAFATPAPGGVQVPGAEADLDRPLRPNLRADLGSDGLGAEAVLVSDYMTLGFGADATGNAAGNQASVTFNRRGDMVKVCGPSERICVRR